MKKLMECKCAGQCHRAVSCETPGNPVYFMHPVEQRAINNALLRSSRIISAGRRISGPSNRIGWI